MPSAPGSSCSISDKIGQGQRRQALRNQADRRDAQRLQAEEPRRGDAAADRDQRRRRMRPQPLHADQHRERRHRHGQRDQRGFGNVLRDAQDVGKEALLGDVDAQELGHLVEHDHEADPGLEAGQDRRGNEVGDEPQPQQAASEQHRADQRGQRGRRRDELGRVAVRNRQAELRAGQDRQRGGGTDAEHARRAEQRVDHHRDEGGVQTDGDGQAGDGRVGHGLGQDDRGGRQAGDHVEAQSALAGRVGRRLDRRRVHAVAPAGAATSGGSHTTVRAATRPDPRIVWAWKVVEFPIRLYVGYGVFVQAGHVRHQHGNPCGLPVVIAVTESPSRPSGVPRAR